MTKAIRIENADTSKYKVKVIVQDKINDEWVTNSENVLDYPTSMLTEYIHTTRRLLIVENGFRDD